MTKLVTILGGSGFVGRYIAQRMAAKGWRVRVACRNPNEALFVRTYGVVGQVEPVACNIRDEASVAMVLNGANAAVNCIGILAEKGRNGFDAVQSEGAERVARLAAKAGLERLVQISAIGADADAASDYARTKGEGEAAVKEHFPNAVILRPSIIFGPEDEFFNRFGELTRLSPALPLVGAETRFQPVYVDDVAQAAEKALTEDVAPGIYELGGPEVQTFRELMKEMLQVIRRGRLVVGLPFWMGHVQGFTFEILHKISFGLVPLMITRDQVHNLRHDNVVSGDYPGLSDLGIEPMAMEAILPDYLWRFRPQGQYSDITASARNFKS